MRAAATVTIRPGAVEDAPRITEIHVRSWQHAYRGLLPDAYLDGLSVEDRTDRWRDTLAQTDDRNGVVVVELGGRTVGFASFCRSRDDDAADEVGEIPAIHLEPEAVGLGIGRRLFEATVGALRRAGFRRGTLWVLETNERARRFYEATGWAWDGTVSRHDFDRANEPIVRYAAEL